jgi:hypothetical protein
MQRHRTMYPFPSASSGGQAMGVKRVAGLANERAKANDCIAAHFFLPRTN